MLVIASILVAWLVVTALLLRNQASILRALWREPVLARPVLIVESDDWGPGPATDAAMLDRLHHLLAGHRDAEGRPAVMTLGVVLGKPDGAAILASDCQDYRRSTLLEARYAPIVDAMRAGCTAGVFALQRHGLEHCWPPSLLMRAREDEALRRWLADPAARSETLPSALQSRWTETSTLPSRPLPAQAVAAAVSEEQALFACLFGQAPAVAVPNTFVWDDVVERAWADTGVRCVVTCGRQFEGRAADGGLKPPTRTLRNGEHGVGGVCYVVRDAYFEPIRGHRAEQVWQAVAQRSAVGRPTLLETHRESFIEPASAEAALAELGRALGGVLARHPDVCFISTEQLAKAFDDPQHALRQRGPALRAATFLRRMRAEPALSRPLKLCGLYFLLPLAARLAAAVTPAAAGSRSG